jgi:hypothetical protein
MAGMNIRRLAAVDMYGTRGAKRRRRIIRAELITEAVVMVASGSQHVAAERSGSASSAVT